ncbi:MAG: helix-turn-helix domain-containing protein, partial [Elusimicrobiota bacterium]|nr:helix-turn-helix domain-containing protein [Elusimicrobiota bacterium]
MFEKVSGEQIKQALKEAELTQEECSKITKINRVQLSDYITGKRNPKRETLEKIAKATKKPLEYFAINNSAISTGDITGD